jgi:hypothetical protein
MTTERNNVFTLFLLVTKSFWVDEIVDDQKRSGTWLTNVRKEGRENKKSGIDGNGKQKY